VREQRLVGGEQALAGLQHPVVGVVEGRGGGVQAGPGGADGVVGGARTAEGGGEGGAQGRVVGVGALVLEPDAVLEGGAVREAQRVGARQHHQVLGGQPAAVERLLQLLEASRRPRQRRRLVGQRHAPVPPPQGHHPRRTTGLHAYVLDGQQQ